VLDYDSVTMQRETPHTSHAKADALRSRVDEARNDAERLAALLALARHYAEAADGVRGLAAASQARTLAMEANDNRALSHALNSASISHYHRSDYLSAVATAMDAWDYAHRVHSRLEIAGSYATIGIALFALGDVETADRIADRGLTLCGEDSPLLEPRVRLIRLKATLAYVRGSLTASEALFALCTQLAEGCSKAQLASCLGNWGIALLREGEKLASQQEDAGQVLSRARQHLEAAMRIAQEDGDALVVADRICTLGGAALIANQLDEAEKLLCEALEQSRAMDYVRTLVVTSLYLGRLYLKRGDAGRAVVLLTNAANQAKRGATEDLLIQTTSQLADALDLDGQPAQAGQQRALVEQMRQANAADRAQASEDARKLARRILGN
jgi:tetratricopeptide (TPR) repeat protein